MKSLSQRVRASTRLLLQTPSIGLASLVYSALFYLSSLRADFLDIGDPWWVVTVGFVLLGSPLYHAFVIARVGASAAEAPFTLRDVPIESYGDLVIGEVLVNAMVVLGSALFLLPGIYAGLRMIYYKQAIVLHKARGLDALRQSLRETGDPRVLWQTFVILGVAYTIPLAMSFLLSLAAVAWWTHIVAVLVSTAFIASVNVYLTLSFVQTAARAGAGDPV